MKKPGGGWAGKGSRQSRGYGRKWEKLRAVVLARDQGLCRSCARWGRVEGASHVDHIVPKAEGGTDELSNLQAMCLACHARKTAEEGGRAQGRKVKPRIGLDGWPEDL